MADLSRLVAAETERQKKAAAEQVRLARVKALEEAKKLKEENDARIAVAKQLFLAEAMPMIYEDDAESKVADLLIKYGTGLDAINLNNWLLQLNNPQE